MSLNIQFIDADFEISEIGSESWAAAANISIDKYWSGESAPEKRHASAKLLWSKTALYVHFSCNQYEPLVVNETPKLAVKTNSLWNRDVCEIFIAPDKKHAGHYFEFEIAPTGEWLDLEIKFSGKNRETNLDYDSEMRCAAEVSATQLRAAAKIPWEAFGKMPCANEIWFGNLFRIVGAGESRGYLAWRPTETQVPNFHVPSKFGEFIFQE